MQIEESDSLSSDGESVSSTDVEDIEGEEFNRDELYENLNNQDSQTFAERVMNSDRANPIAKIRETILLAFLYLCLWKNFNLVSDNGLDTFLGFTASFLKEMGWHDIFKSIAGVCFPASGYLLWKYIGLRKHSYVKYVTCSKCYALYDIDECTYTDTHGQTKPRRCMNIRFTAGKFSRPCNTPLMHKYMGDIYDGKVWDSFKKYNGVSFLEERFNYAFMLNCDWFQPFKRRKDISIGVMYLVVLNLPRHLRFKRENMILVGVIPSFNKEPEILNSF